MKSVLTLWVLICGLWVAAINTSCTTSQQTTAYKTLYGLEVATTGAYDAYSKAVIAGSVPTNDVPKVSHAFNDFQAGMQAAVVAVQNNTNALAPANLVSESDAVINLITTINGGH
jgi:hypothetical protein